MNIALFTETYIPMINGVVTHVKTLKEGLEGLGHKVIIVTADAHVKKHEMSGDVLYCPAVKLKRIYNYDIASPLSTKRLRLLRQFKPDIIHIHNEFGIGISGIFIAKILRIPLVYTMHTMYDDYVYYVANKHLCNFVTRATHKYAQTLAAAAKAVIGPSKKVEEYFKRCGVKKEISVIPNSAELDLFNTDRVDERQRRKVRQSFGFSDNDFVFVFCGRLGKEKNVKTLLKYFAETVKPDDHIKLLIIGDGPLYDAHKSEVEEYGISHLVKFAGKVMHNRLPPYYAACDAYITASLSDTYSISVLEAMAMKLPVLHINDEHNRTLVIEGVNGYFYSDAAQMYRLMLKLCGLSENELLCLKDQVRNSVEKSDCKALAAGILEIYHAVMKDNKKKKKKRRRH